MTEPEGNRQTRILGFMRAGLGMAGSFLVALAGAQLWRLYHWRWACSAPQFWSASAWPMRQPPFWSMPGGASEMANLSDMWNAAVDRVAAAHAMRVALVVLIVPLALAGCRIARDPPGVAYASCSLGLPSVLRFFW